MKKSEEKFVENEEIRKKRAKSAESRLANCERKESFVGKRVFWGEL